MAKKKPIKSMADISAGYEKFINGKEPKPDGKQVFESAVKKAVKKQPSAK